MRAVRWLRVLLLEDCHNDFELILHNLCHADFETVGEGVQTQTDLLALIDPALAARRYRPGADAGDSRAFP